LESREILYSINGKSGECPSLPAFDDFSALGLRGDLFFKKRKILQSKGLFFKILISKALLVKYSIHVGSGGGFESDSGNPRCRPRLGSFSFVFSYFLSIAS
jgi:hypothetical protein